jgi:hypothetical protein
MVSAVVLPHAYRTLPHFSESQMCFMLFVEQIGGLAKLQMKLVLVIECWSQPASCSTELPVTQVESPSCQVFLM